MDAHVEVIVLKRPKAQEGENKLATRHEGTKKNKISHKELSALVAKEKKKNLVP